MKNVFALFLFLTTLAICGCDEFWLTEDDDAGSGEPAAVNVPRDLTCSVRLVNNTCWNVVGLRFITGLDPADGGVSDGGIPDGGYTELVNEALLPLQPGRWFNRSGVVFIPAGAGASFVVTWGQGPPIDPVNPNDWVSQYSVPPWSSPPADPTVANFTMVDGKSMVVQISISQGPPAEADSFLPTWPISISVQAAEAPESTTPPNPTSSDRCSQSSTICASYVNTCQNTVSQGPCYCAAACECYVCGDSCFQEHWKSARNVNYTCPSSF